MPETGEISIRRSVSGDRDALFEIWHGAVTATHDFLTAEDIAFYARVVRDDYLPLADFWVAVDGDRPVGFIGTTEANIDALFVDPRRHGEGIGRALVQHVWARGGGVTVDVNEANTAGRGFYAHLGYRVVGRSPLDDIGRPFPLLHLARTAGA